MEKVDNMQEQVDNVSRELEILRKIMKEMLEMENTGTEKKSFDGLISTLDTPEERISDLFDMTMETSKIGNTKTKKSENKRTGNLRTVG